MRLKKLSAEDFQLLTSLISTELSSREVSRRLRYQVSKTTINNLRYILKQKVASPTSGAGPRVLLLDIETTPEISFTWGRWKQHISQVQVIEHPYILTWACRWMDTGETVSRKLTDYPGFAAGQKCDRALTTELWQLLQEADIVVAHNGDKFDIPWVQARAIKYGLPPLNPTKFVDTLKVAKSLIRVPSYSLDSLTQYYDLRPKLGNAGFSLWRSCMEGSTQAFLDMETYNRGDLDALEDLYLLFRPYMKAHPNAALYFSDAVSRCSRCGSVDVHEQEALYHTSLSSFGTVRCAACGAVHRTRKNVRTKEQLSCTILGV